LKELKKKCGCGHHNKKKKTLLHVVKMAKALEARQECFQLTVRQVDAAGAGDDLVSQIQDAIVEAEREGDSVSLDDITEIIPEVPAAVFDADYVPPAAAAEAMTCVINGAELIRDLYGSIETISISKAKLDNAMTFHTGDPISLLDPEVNWVFTSYGHGHGLTMHKNKAIKKISVSRDGSMYELELHVGLEARAWWRNNNNAPHLVAISGYKRAALDEAGELPIMEHEKDYENYGRTLAISSDMYEVLQPEPESNDGPTQWLQVTESLKPETLSRFEKGQRHLLSVGNTHAAVSVTKVTTDPVEKKATVVFGYEGGSVWDL
jgi:hypothetical protein